MLQVSTAVNELFNKLERYCVAPGLVERSQVGQECGRGEEQENEVEKNK